MALTQISTHGVKDNAVTAGKIPANAIGSSEIAADAVTQAEIAGASIDEAKMNISNSGSNGQFLQKQSGNTGGLTWADVPAGVGGSNGADFNDNVKIRLGTGNDFEIYHDGTNSIQFFDAQVGAVRFRTDIGNSARNNIVLGQGVDLYHANNKRFETTADGATLTGRLSPAADDSYGLGQSSLRFANLFLSGDIDMKDSDKIKLGTGDDLQIWHDGSDSYIQDSNSASDLFINSNKDLTLKIGNGSGGYHTAFYADNNGAARLYHIGSEKIKTTSTGVQITGNAVVTSKFRGNDNVKLSLGDGEDIQIYHDGTATRIYNSTGALNFTSSDFTFNSVGNGAQLARFTHTGACEFYHNGTVAFKTLSGGGLDLYGDIVGGDGRTIKLGGSADLKINHASNYSVINDSSSAGLVLRNDAGADVFIQTNADVRIGKEGSSEYYIYAFNDSRVDIFYDNSKKFETLTTGAHIVADADLRFANGAWTGETAGKIQHHGNCLYIQMGSNGTIFRNNSGTDRWQITGVGNLLPAANDTYEIGGGSNYVKKMFLHDLMHRGTFGSANLVYPARAWCNFHDGGTIQGDGGFSSVTDQSTGEYRCYLSFSMPNNNYSVVATNSNGNTSWDDGDDTGDDIALVGQKNANNFYIFGADIDDGNDMDLEDINVVCFR